MICSRALCQLHGILILRSESLSLFVLHAVIYNLCLQAAHTVRLKANHTAAPWLQVTGKKKLGERIAQGMEAVISLHCTALGKVK